MGADSIPVAMSYASVTAHNAPPLEDQPHPDQALLNTIPPHHSGIADDAAKLNIVPPEFKEHPHTYTSEAERFLEEEETSLESEANPHKSHKHSNRHHKGHSAAHAKACTALDTVKHYLIRPGVAGGLIGLVNIGLIASVGRVFYLRPDLRRDATALSSAAAAAITLLTVEGYAAEKYRRTPRSQEEERKAKEEGALIFRHLHEQILRPGVLGGIVGIVNTGLLASLGYVSYKNWHTTWDRRTVSAISIGLLALWGGEVVLAEKFYAHRK